MKREELKAILGENATDEVISKIMDMNGFDVEQYKIKLTESEAKVAARDDKLKEYSTKETEWLKKDASFADLQKKIDDITKEKEGLASAIMARDIKDAKAKALSDIQTTDKDLLALAINFDGIEYKDGAYNKEQLDKAVEDLRKSKPILFPGGEPGSKGGNPADQIQKDLTIEQLINL